MGSRPNSILTNRWKVAGVVGALALTTSHPATAYAAEPVKTEEMFDSESFVIGSVSDLTDLAGSPPELASAASPMAAEEVQDKLPISAVPLEPRKSADDEESPHAASASGVSTTSQRRLCFRATRATQLRTGGADDSSDPATADNVSVVRSTSTSGATYRENAATSHSDRQGDASRQNVQRVSFRNSIPELRDLLHGYGISMGLRAGVTYDDNVNLANGGQRSKTSSFVFTLSPFIRITRGGPSGYEGGSRNSFSLQYSPSFVFYEKENNLNNAPQSLDFTASFLFSRLQVNVSQQFLYFADAAFRSNEIRDERKFYTGSVNAYYALTPKLQVSSSLFYGVRDVENGFENYGVSASTSLFFALTPKLSVGPGIVAGVDYVDGQRSQPSEQVNVSLYYNTHHKLNFNFTIGAELRQGVDDNLGLVYSGGLNYNITDRSQLSLNVYRRNTNASVFIDRTSANNPVYGIFNQNFTATGAGLSFNQRVLDKLSLTGSLNYENSAYFTSGRGDHSAGDFNYYSAGVTLSVPIADWASVNASYFYRQNVGKTRNQSGLRDDGVEFQNNQISFYVSMQL